MKNALLAIALFIGIFTAHAQDKKIKVLNVGMFHMGFTTDANKTEFDEASNMKQIQEVNELLARFKPTIIMVETLPKYQKELEKAYQAYVNDPTIKTGYANNEIQIMAFEIGRLANTKRIYAIDHKMNYAYNLSGLAEEYGAEKYFETEKRKKEVYANLKTTPMKSSFKEVLNNMNTEEYRTASINGNADKLTYVNSEDNFEGADQAAIFYQRNLRMFANINKVESNEEDRILVISGAAHATFFHDFFKRSYIYELESVEKYLTEDSTL
ncbi:DUF5694 domain-containing protein [Aureibacter tunicatorum]|uniref:TraB/GumN family protein n=1 Tax=Aureibacter tunicatorum TaxID=866807 RepID=A0AAE4BT27_9BACT|nr:DUF5694 domain-containing protein [Aureibacter tunicatorum]MDR6239530.1 hypothetical protein [Aureibacter tunicatorum]BDD04007.1 hypothetical protein AUTU_14900 [Aureibacter tunicatorum]